MIPIKISSLASPKIDAIIVQLVYAINSSGGLLLEDNEEPDALDEEDEIDVPKSDYMEEVDIKEEPGLAPKKIVDVKDITLAVPKDKAAPYDNQWIELADEQNFDLIKFSDYDLIAFKYVDDENYAIVEANYED